MKTRENKRMLFIQTYMFLLIVRMGLLLFGFGKVYRFIAGVKPRNREILRNADERINKVCYTVKAASRYQFVQSQCLEQSFVLYYLLKREGVNVNLCIGVSKWPFASHAWVEIQGEIINTPPCSLRGEVFRVMLRV